MAFWSRLRQSRFKFYAFSYEFKRFYNLNPCPIIANRHISSRTLVPILNNPKFVVEDGQLEFFRKVRFYAARGKHNQKKEKKDTTSSEPRINEEITAPTVRLVTDEDHCVISRYEAMARARSLGLDLVEVDKPANPPVCKIFDYNKLKYIQHTKEKERAKSKSELKKGPPKDVRFAGKIKTNDLRVKADTAKRLMESGYRVKCTATDSTDDVDLKALLSRFTALIDEVAILESTPKYEKKQAFVVVRHVKFGPSKGSGKKASKNAVSSETGSPSGKNQPFDETIEVSSGSEHVDSEEYSDEDVQTNKSERAVFEADDDMRSKSSKHDQSSFTTGPPSYSAGGNQRHIVEPGPTNTASTLPFEIPKPAMENRYARDPKSAKPQRIPTDMNGRGGRNAMNSVLHMPNPGNASPQMRPSRQVEVPAHEISEQEGSRSRNPNSTAKSYGIFSAPQVNTPPREQNAPAATNRYMKSGPSDSARSPSTPGPAAESRMNNATQGRWGAFSSDNNSRVVPDKNENRAEIQRR